MAENPTPNDGSRRPRPWLKQALTFGKWALIGLVLALPYWWLNTQFTVDVGIWPIIGLVIYLTRRNHERGKQNRFLRTQVRALTLEMDDLRTLANTSKERLDQMGAPMPPPSPDPVGVI